MSPHNGELTDGTKWRLLQTKRHSVEIDNTNSTIRFRPSEILFEVEVENNQAKHD